MDVCSILGLLFLLFVSAVGLRCMWWMMKASAKVAAEEEAFKAKRDAEHEELLATVQRLKKDLDGLLHKPIQLPVLPPKEPNPPPTIIREC